MTRSPDRAYAIVGQACVLPGALTPDQLWSCVLANRSELSATPPGRWRIDDDLILASVGQDRRDRAVSAQGGYVSGFEAVFDAGAYALPADALLGLDPLVHWLLHVGREALLDSQFTGDRGRVGAVIGNLSYPSSSLSRYAERCWLGPLADSLGLAPVDARNRFMSGLPAHVLARALGLGAGAYALDAACASSLYAVKLACDTLAEGRADLMLAGAVNRADDLFLHAGFTALGALSPTGRSRPFHAGADGLVPGEGAVMLALRRLDDAERDGDPILGIVRAVGVSNDGRGRGLLVPSEAGQLRALESAYRQAALSPADIGLVECHATGTTVGDAVELGTLARLFAGRARPVPIGSLKANLGHLITAAGGAGVLKVLGALRHGVLPPSPLVDEPAAALVGAPLRLVVAAEPWSAPGPRRAAVSAFGFGGNNAHLLVEEAPARPRRPRSRGVSAVDSARRSADGAMLEPEIAIVAIGARVADGACTAEFARALFTGDSRLRAGRAAATEIALSMDGLRFPPADLRETLPQQLLLLSAAEEAVRGLHLPRERTAVFVGMQCDAEIARHGARWRAAGWARALGAPASWTDAAKDGFVPLLGSAGVIGAMPNIPANRLSSQLDLGAMSFTVSAEELSGLRALELARRALCKGEIEAALVGAVDLAAEPVHLAAAAALLPAARRDGGDAAIMLVLKRLEDARRDGDRVIALVDPIGSVRQEASGDELLLGDGGLELAALFGHAHAASGLVHIAAAALCCAHAARPGAVGSGRVTAWTSEARVATVRIVALGDPETTVRLRALRTRERLPIATEDATTGFLSALHESRYKPAAPLLTFAAHRAAPSVPPLPRSISRPYVQTMRPAPALPLVLDARRWTRSTGSPSSSPIQSPVPALSPPQLRPPSQFGAPGRLRSPLGPVLDGLLAQRRRVAELHADWLTQQATLQAQFVDSRRRALDLLLSRSTSSRWSPPPALHLAPPSTSLAPSAPSSWPADPQRAANGLLAADPRGPTYTRRELEVHASGRISSLFGPAFEGQDEHALQVRMPEPPLLLADRVTGLHAEASSMKLGTVWTETDVHADSWYLNRGFMPAGIMIEAGQADLFLISYLGIDALNRGERSYRLLGCELTYHGGLPRPGDTLRYAIDIDGHARQGDVRLFFFHYDCRIGERAALSVRQGQAGFFTREELLASAGVLWDPSAQVLAPDARVDAPMVECARRQFSSSQVLAFASGDLHACFGPGFELGLTHVRTPAIQAPPMLLFDEVRELDVRGGPWRRGYLRVALAIHADDWFFAGHFKNDPCMPGTLMFEGCLQAMAFYLAALGYTIARDGWRFEPVPEEAYKLSCRGQVLPSSRELICEIFVEEVHDGPIPTLYADLLGTVDGHKAFHARRVGLRLVPDWPLSDAGRAAAHTPVGSESGAIAEVDGFCFDHASLLACAWGRPSAAFGPMYARFDGTRRVARLPGPPYHFMSRVSRIDGPIGVCKPGASIEIAYDVPPDAWYFDDNGHRVMPYCVLLEMVLQPCGWLASYVGSALLETEDLKFRNLDGTGRVLAELPPGAGTLRTVTNLRSVSRSAGMILQSFTVRCYAGETPIYELDTGFGFFPSAALENQIGLPTTGAQRAQLERACDFAVDLRARPPRYCEGSLRLAASRLLMLDRVTACDPRGGARGLGFVRGEKDVDPGEWFFKAHFFQDPVQPGSLGLEAMLQLLQFFMLHTGLGEGLDAPRFEAIALDQSMTWKYRGQVVPSDRLVCVTLELTEVGRDERGAHAIASGSLWVDGKRIYEASGLGMRIVAATPALRPVALARAHWRRWFGVEAAPVEDLYRALLGRFLGQVLVADTSALRVRDGRGLLFLGNHQTAVESTVFAILASALVGAPVLTLAKRENQAHWLFRLMQHSFAYPGLRDPQMTAHFDRSDPASLPGILAGLGAALESGRSVMVHVEGTRSLDCRTPVSTMSGTFIELALSTGCAIVPVRFSGGLPTDPLAERAELPVGMGRQNIHFGRPLEPLELRPLNYRERRERVMASINELGIAAADELPSPPDLAFEEIVHAAMRSRGLSLGPAALLEALRELPDPCRAIEALLADAATPPDGVTTAEVAWLAELRRSLLGAPASRAPLSSS